MVITQKNIIGKLLKDDVIQQSYVYSYKSKKYWKINKPIDVMLSNNNVITIPEGFYYDMATIPKWLWSIVRPYNDALFATLIHDYLYIHQETHDMTRYQVDKEFLLWSNLTNRNKLDNKIRYIFARAFGWLWWKKII